MNFSNVVKTLHTVPWWGYALGAGASWAAYYFLWLDTPELPDTPENREWLARILMTEHNNPKSKTEWLGIAWVAINRAVSQGKTIRQVVDTSAWFGASPPDRLYGNALLTKGRGPEAVALADKIFEGDTSNPIGKREKFVHPGGMPKCSAFEWVTRAKTQTRACRYVPGYGMRWMPYWITAPMYGGTATNFPLRQGAAVFAECWGDTFRAKRKP